jgi:hypothetical protein
MDSRTLLPDCCEDWILQYGGFYETGSAFQCLECGTGWRKSERRSFRRETDGVEFRKTVRTGDDAEFASLVPVDGPAPLLDRCCAQILLRLGPAMKVERFDCPVCHTAWRQETTTRAGVRVRTFSHPGLPEPLAISRGRTRPFLVPLSRYAPPGD